jgi:murein DD-endopeptidase MepM/ murein hydrolase activator NlpD
MNRIAVASVLLLAIAVDPARADADVAHKGLDVTTTGLFPRYPSGQRCPTMTSLYASWADVDGTRRDERHSGVDAGALGDQIIAPAPGMVIASWQANWGWGQEGAIILRHRREDLGLTTGPAFYYSEFDHLRYAETREIPEGRFVERGEPLATVFRPGGNRHYLPEVHWEVWQVKDEDETKWLVNKFGGRYWVNSTSRLIDPLYMLSLNDSADEDGGVDLPIFARSENYSDFRGFTYIFSCHPTHPH